MKEHLEWAGDAVEFRDGIPHVADPGAFREETVEPLIRRAVFHPRGEVRRAAAWMLRHAALDLGAAPASLHDLYKAVGHGEAGGFTVPAFHVRGMTYAVCRRIFRCAAALEAGPFILALARSEIRSTGQSPREYSAAVLAAAIREGYRGPVFLQGDHFQTRGAGRKRPIDQEMQTVRTLIEESVRAGLFQIDVDASPLVDRKAATPRKRQQRNVEATAHLASCIRDAQPPGVVAAIGAEVGEGEGGGGRRSTVEDVRAFMEGFAGRRAGFDLGTAGLCKLSVRARGAGEGRVDFDLLRKLSQVARGVYKLGGVVQHGASSLPLEALRRFPGCGVIEVHLSSTLQDLVLGAPEFPADLLEEIEGLLAQAFGDERAGQEPRQQFLRRVRGKAWGPFKRELWDLPQGGVLDPILDRLEGRVRSLFESLGVAGTRGQVERWVRPVPVAPPPPPPPPPSGDRPPGGA